MKWHKSLRIRMFIGILIMIIMIIGLTSVVIISKTYYDTGERIFDNNMKIAIVLQETLDTLFLELKNTMQVVSYTTEIQNFEYDKVDLLLKKMVKINPSISQMYLIDKNGMQVYKTSFTDTLGNRSDRDYFKKSIEGEVYISDVIISRSTGVSISTISVPIYSNDQIIGVLGASIEFDKINQIVNRSDISEKDYAYVVDRYGQVIVHPKEDMVNEMHNLSHLKPVNQGLSGVDTYTFEGIEKLVSYVPMKENDWGVLVQVPADVAFKEINESIKWMLIIFAISIITTVIISIIISNHFMAPIKETVKILKRIGNRNFEVNFSIKREDEFGLIQNAIKDMACEVKSVHENLENTVDERTKDLNIAKKGLERYVIELKEIQSELLIKNLTLKDTIDKLSETEKILVETEKISALGRFAIHLSHEFNTPLGIGITTATFMLRETRNLKDDIENGRILKSQLQEYIDLMLESGQSVLNQFKKPDELIKAFKMISADNYNKEKENITIIDEINDSIKIISATSKCPGYKIEVECDKNIKYMGYRGAIRDILAHLFDNSLSHGCKIEGELNIDISVVEFDNILKIIYKDNGSGIKKEDVSKIFEPLYKGGMSKNGMGIGLSRVYNIVKIIINGQIACESEIGKGIKFTIEIPKKL